MANLPESATWEAGIYQIEVTDPVLGGVDGISNQQGKQLANRTSFLKAATDDHETRVENLEATASILSRLKGAGSLVKQGVVTSALTNNIFDFLAVAKITTSPILNRVSITANATSPLVIGFSKGYDANGPIVYYGIVSANQEINSGSNTAGLLYAEYDETTAAVSFGLDTSTTSVVISYNTPSTTGYWYSLKDEKLYKWNGSAWVVQVRVIIASISWQGSGSYTYALPIGKGIKDVYGRGHVPAGSVSAFAGASAPDGYLTCNGAALSRTIYSDLFSAIGTTYGVGDGSTTFNIPDLRGEFIRGLDGGRGVDSGRTLGSYQADELKSHTHTYRGATITPTGSDPTGTGSTFTIGNTGSTGGTETRPRNIAMNFIIKF